jgi:hypothetical protein
VAAIVVNATVESATMALLGRSANGVVVNSCSYASKPTALGR